MMGSRGYTVLGWVVYQIGRRLLKYEAKSKVKNNRAKLGAAGVIALVIVGGVIAARSASNS
jgi:hypothetical protein